MNDPVGLYLHIPFCIQKCAYCDFCSTAAYDDSVTEAYTRALCLEIDAYQGRNIRADTVFFGGGTPPLLGAHRLHRVLDALYRTFSISPDAELTIEANPATLTLPMLRDYRAWGVNRLSIGMQSLQAEELAALGRVHGVRDFTDCLDMARSVGFENINADVMYGIPGQTAVSFADTLEKLLTYGLPHLSVYGLMVEPGTPFWRRRATLALPDEDTEYGMYRLACERLGQAGYGHYEISNYAKEGYRCRHNLKYWLSAPYIGLGVAAHSYFEGRRYGHTDSLERYLACPTEAGEKERIDRHEAEKEAILLGLRLAQGIDEADFVRRFGHPFRAGRLSLLRQFAEGGFAVLSETDFALTEQGMYVSNTLLAELLAPL